MSAEPAGATPAVALLGAMLSVLLGVALAAVVDAGGAVTVVVTGGAVGEWHAVIPATAAAVQNAVNRLRVDITFSGAAIVVNLR